MCHKRNSIKRLVAVLQTNQSTVKCIGVYKPSMLPKDVHAREKLFKPVLDANKDIFLKSPQQLQFVDIEVPVGFLYP